jgi:hypothetical protein
MNKAIFIKTVYDRCMKRVISKRKRMFKLDLIHQHSLICNKFHGLFLGKKIIIGLSPWQWCLPEIVIFLKKLIM